MIDLRTCHWCLPTPRKPTPNVDMYIMTSDGGVVTLGVPPGQTDVAEFVHRCLIAGQKLLRQIPPGSPFEPHKGDLIVGENNGTQQ